MGNVSKQQAEKSLFVYVTDAKTGKLRRTAVPSNFQVGLDSAPADLKVTGQLQVLERLSVASSECVVAATATTITINENNTIASIRASGSARTVIVKLPAAPQNGQLHFLKDASGTAATITLRITPQGTALIDQSAYYDVTTAYGTCAVYWEDGNWHVLVTSSGGGVGGAPTTAQYVTLATDATLTNERVLTAGSGISIVDGGPGSTVTVSSTGGAPTTAQYVTLATDAALSNERVLTAGTGLTLTDGGSNNPVTLSINNNVVATVSGTRFTGNVVAASGLSGSLQQTSAGLSYLVAGTNITITSQSNGQVLVEAPGGGYTLAFTNADLIGNAIAVTHNLGIRYANINVYDNNNLLVIPDSVTATSANAASVNLASFVPIPGTWQVSAFAGGVSSGSSGGSGLPKQDHIQVVAANQNVEVSVFTAISAFEFVPDGAESMAPDGATTWTAYFQPILEVFPAGATAEIRLYNVTNSSVVANSLLTSTQISPERLRTPNLYASLPSGINVYEVQMRLQSAGAGYRATCKGAKLLITWS